MMINRFFFSFFEKVKSFGIDFALQQNLLNENEITIASLMNVIVIILNHWLVKIN